LLLPETTLKRFVTHPTWYSKSESEIYLIDEHKQGGMMHLLKRLAILGIIAVLIFSTDSFAQQPSPKESLSVPPHGASFKGKHAPNFVLRDLSGKSISLKDYAGKPIVLNFWATWCPPCLLEMPWFEESARKYAESGLTILGLSVDIESSSATPEKIAATVKRLGVTYPILLSDKSLKLAYGPVHLLPETFYINRNGVIVEDIWGHADKASIDRNIGEIVKR
jgi:peroxiredoxin